MERSAYIWNYDGGNTQALRLAGTGANLAWIKAGGDRGIVWIPGSPTGGFARPQWHDAYLAPLTTRGVACNPWFYNWPVEADKGAVLKALAHRWADSVALNPETEWRVHSEHSPYSTLSAGNQYAIAWVNDLRARIRSLFGRAPKIGFSGVPSWADFPYEGFAAACDFSHPQHYWHDELMARGENQVEAHFRRAPSSPCIPILTACREYDDAGVVRLARSALLHPIRGFSAWEAGNAAFQAAAMKQAYALLPGDTTGEDEVKEPGEGEFDAYQNAQGQTIFVWNAGGVAVETVGINAVDLGVSVKNAEGKVYDRSLQSNVSQAWQGPREEG